MAGKAHEMVRTGQMTERTKKVISFSLWGDNPLYINGAIANAEMREEFYPDWVCRFYYGDVLLDEGTKRVQVPSDVISKLTELGCEMYRMGDTVDVLGMYWRFHPMFDDPTINRFIVRDTDSKFSKREVAAVNEWIESDLDFHIMRDCESHGVTMLGGTWGAKAGCIPAFETYLHRWFSIAQPCKENPRGLFHGTDQIFLDKVIWPIIKEDRHIAHDEHFNFTGRELPFPVAMENGHYVGMVC